MIEYDQEIAIQNLIKINQKLEIDKKQTDEENENLKRKVESNEAQINDLKTKLNKFDDKENASKDLKQENVQLRSENKCLTEKFESLLNDNKSVQAKFDSNLLEMNSLKCKYEEKVRELNEIRRKNDELKASSITPPSILTVSTQTPIVKNVDDAIQTDESLLQKNQREYDQILSDYVVKQESNKNEITQLKNSLHNSGLQFKELNRQLEIAFNSNSELTDRNKYLYEKCAKLKNEMKEKANEFLQFKSNFEIKREVLETTIDQQRNAINFIVPVKQNLRKNRR